MTAFHCAPFSPTPQIRRPPYYEKKYIGIHFKMSIPYFPWDLRHLLHTRPLVVRKGIGNRWERYFVIFVHQAAMLTQLMPTQINNKRQQKQLVDFALCAPVFRAFVVYTRLVYLLSHVISRFVIVFTKKKTLTQNALVSSIKSLEIHLQTNVRSWSNESLVLKKKFQWCDGMSL